MLKRKRPGVSPGSGDISDDDEDLNWPDDPDLYAEDLDPLQSDQQIQQEADSMKALKTTINRGKQVACRIVHHGQPEQANRAMSALRVLNSVQPLCELNENDGPQAELGTRRYIEWPKTTAEQRPQKFQQELNSAEEDPDTILKELLERHDNILRTALVLLGTKRFLIAVTSCVSEGEDKDADKKVHNFRELCAAYENIVYITKLIGSLLRLYATGAITLQDTKRQIIALFGSNLASLTPTHRWLKVKCTMPKHKIPKNDKEELSGVVCNDATDEIITKIGGAAEQKAKWAKHLLGKGGKNVDSSKILDAFPTDTLDDEQLEEVRSQLINSVESAQEILAKLKVNPDLYVVFGDARKTTLQTFEVRGGSRGQQNTKVKELIEKVTVAVEAQCTLPSSNWTASFLDAMIQLLTCLNIWQVLVGVADHSFVKATGKDEAMRHPFFSAVYLARKQTPVNGQADKLNPLIDSAMSHVAALRAVLELLLCQIVEDLGNSGNNHLLVEAFHNQKAVSFLVEGCLFFVFRNAVGLRDGAAKRNELCHRDTLERALILLVNLFGEDTLGVAGLRQCWDIVSKYIKHSKVKGKFRHWIPEVTRKMYDKAADFETYPPENLLGFKGEGQQDVAAMWIRGMLEKIVNVLYQGEKDAMFTAVCRVMQTFFVELPHRSDQDRAFPHPVPELTPLADLEEIKEAMTTNEGEMQLEVAKTADIIRQLQPHIDLLAVVNGPQSQQKPQPNMGLLALANASQSRQEPQPNMGLPALTDASQSQRESDRRGNRNATDWRLMQVTRNSDQAW